jgi:hypothetical protein
MINEQFVVASFRFISLVNYVQSASEHEFLKGAIYSIDHLCQWTLTKSDLQRTLIDCIYTLFRCINDGHVNEKKTEKEQEEDESLSHGHRSYLT